MCTSLQLKKTYYIPWHGIVLKGKKSTIYTHGVGGLSPHRLARVQRLRTQTDKRRVCRTKQNGMKKIKNKNIRNALKAYMCNYLIICKLYDVCAVCVCACVWKPAGIVYNCSVDCFLFCLTCLLAFSRPIAHTHTQQQKHGTVILAHILNEMLLHCCYRYSWLPYCLCCQAATCRTPCALCPLRHSVAKQVTFVCAIAHCKIDITTVIYVPFQSTGEKNALIK